MWYDNIVMILRFMIGDTSDTPKYTDVKLAQLFLVAAQLVQSDIEQNPIIPSYAIDVINKTITPDPTVEDDIPFINLSLLRAACILAMSKMGKSAFSIVEGTAKLDTTRNVDSLKSSTESFCQSYQDGLWAYRVGASVIGDAVIGPYRALACNYMTPRNCRGFY